MAHNKRVWPDERLKRGLVLTGDDMIAIDEASAAAVNGDDGGTWSPSSPIVVEGAGVGVHALWTMSGAGVRVITSFGKYITFARGDADDYFGLGPSNYYQHPIMLTLPQTFVSSPPMGAIALPTGGGVRTTVHGVTVRIELNVYDRASFDLISLLWTVGQSHSVVPYRKPRMRVIAVDLDGTVTPLKKSYADGVPGNVDGWIGPPDAVLTSGSAYYNGGNAQGIHYACDVPHRVDRSRFAYFLEFQDEDFYHYPPPPPPPPVWAPTPQEESNHFSSWTTVGNTLVSIQVQFKDVTLFDNRQ